MEAKNTIFCERCDKFPLYIVFFIDKLSSKC